MVFLTLPPFFQGIPCLRQPFQVPQVRGRVAAARQVGDVLEAQLMVPRRQADVVRVVTSTGAGWHPQQSGWFTLWLFNIAMENGPFIDGLPLKNGDFPWLC